MPNVPNRIFWILLLFIAAPQALAQQRNLVVAVPFTPEWLSMVRAIKKRPPALETLISNTPWSVPATSHRYGIVASDFWEHQKWQLSPEDGWEAIELIAANARGDIAFAKSALSTLEYHVSNMTDSEMAPLAEHMGGIVKALPRDCLTWIQMQAWRVTLLTDRLRWEDSIPLLEEIEGTLLQEKLNGTGSVKPVFVHLDCSTAYLDLGIHERAIQHMALAQASFQTLPENRDTLYIYSHLIMHQMHMLASSGDDREGMNLLKRTRKSKLYDQLPPQMGVMCDFRFKLAQCKLDDIPIKEVEAAYGKLMEITDPIQGPGDGGDEGLRLSALEYLSAHYLQNGMLDKARDLHESAQLVAQTRAVVNSYRSAPAGTRTIPAIFTSFISHIVSALGDETIPEELRGWIETAYSLRLEELSSAPLLPLGMGGDAFANTSNLAECLVQSILQEDPGPQGIERALEALIKRETIGTLAQQLGANDTAPSSLQTQLIGEGSGVYHIHVGWHHIYVFLIDRESISVHRLDTPDEFYKRSHRLTTELRNFQEYGGKPQRFEHAVTSMQASLLPPELALDMQQRDWNTIAFSGFEGMSYVPMELLKLPSGERLGDRMPVTYYPSLATALALATRRNTRKAQRADGWLALVATTAPSAMHPEDRERLASSSPKLLPLPFESEDRDALFGSFPESIDLQVKLDESATQDALRRGSSPDIGALFVMGHGSRDDDLAASPGLLLRATSGGTTVVGPSDLSEFRAPPFSMLVACGTTDAVERSGDDGAQHLVGTLLRQGSDTVLSAHLPLRFDDSKALAAEVMEGLTNRGLTPAGALWQARIKLGDKAGYPGRYLLHANGLADRPLHLPTPTAPTPFGTYTLLSLAAVGAIIVLYQRPRSA
jgi:CHAT domain-containing protein